MRSQFASLRVLVLPFGSLTGPRIVIDGIDGDITLFDNSDVRIVVLGVTEGGLVIGPDQTNPLEMGLGVSGTPSIFFGKTIAGGSFAGFLDQFTFGSYSDFALRLGSPLQDIDTDDRATFILASERALGSVPVTFRFRDENSGTPRDIVRIDGGATPVIYADLGQGNTAMGLGVLDNGFQRLTTNDSARAPGAATDMTRTVKLIAGRLYKAHLHTQVAFAAAGFNATALDYDGASIGQFMTNTIIAGASDLMIDSSVKWIASATDTSAVLTVKNNAASAGNTTFAAGTEDRKSVV